MGRSLIACVLRGLFLSSLLLLSFSVASAQVTNVADDVSTPIPGAGHDYVHLLDETVNPANGSLSLRIQVPIPKARGINIPFSIAYDSDSVEHLLPGSAVGSAVWLGNNTYLSQGGWNFAVPKTSLVATTTQSGSGVGGITYCYSWTNFMFFDPNGGSHALGLGASNSSSGNGICNSFGGERASGGDGVVSATIFSTSQVSPLTVYAQDGTVYNFPGMGLASSIEDRNGNKLNLTYNGTTLAFSYTDTAGRTAISTDGFGPAATTNHLTVSGITTPYQVIWETVTPTFTAPPSSRVDTNPSSSCVAPPGASGTGNTEIKQIILPNGKSYQFFYANAFGLLSEIDYPEGGWVKYTWKWSDQKNELADYPGNLVGSSGTPVPDGCLYQYSAPAIATRTVGFGGTSASLTQSFTYSTTWNTTSGDQAIWTAKQTQICSADNVLGSSVCPTPPTSLPTNAFLKRYTYSAYSVGTNNNFASAPYPPLVPLENATTTYDWGSTSSVLGTSTKTWYNQFDLASETHSIDGSTNAKTTYCYSGATCASSVLLKEKDEYDYGAASATRQTVTTYASMSGGLGVLADFPCKVVTNDGSGTRVAETDYYYDGSATLCGAGNAAGSGVTVITGTHDETNYGASSTRPRGNVTKTVKWLNTGTSPTTTYTYDDTGQPASMTDSCGNATCSDMTGTSHTTTYSFTDSFSSGTPPGQTNAYLTSITHPAVNGVTTHEYFKYSYADAQLTYSQDDNQHAASVGMTYKYNTPPVGCADGLDRLGETDSPDGGVTTYCYNDATYNPSTPSPSVKTTNTITSGVNKVSTLAFDGMGHPIETILNSDPDGAVYSNTVYYGTGRPFGVFNPYRSSSDPTYGSTSYTYDPLGRTKVVTQPDGSTIHNVYSFVATPATDCTTVTDEAGKARKACSDGLGRMTGVWEDPASLNYETDYTYSALDDLSTVTQKGGASSASWRNRSFGYDSLSRLTSATNPESGGLTYTYDYNGNVNTRVDARTITTTYSYDALNRLTKKAYSDGTPTANYFYDQSSAWGISLPDSIGRLTTNSVTTGSTMLAGEVFDYEIMGRVHYTAQCTATNCGTGSYQFPYTYDLMGNIVAESNGQWLTLTRTYNAAGRPTGITSSLVDAGHPATLATVDAATGYFPQGALRKLALGNNLVETGAYNVRLQPCRLEVNSSASEMLNCADATPTGNLLDLTYGYNLGATDNGNLTSWSSTGQQTFARTYLYDNLNNIKSMSAPGSTCSGLSFTIDPWGNRTAQTTTGGTCFQSLAPVSGNTNRVSGLTYDASGNLTNDGTNASTYDAENRITKVVNALNGTTTYAYDADGRRIQKTTSAGGITDYIYDSSGRVVSEWGPGCGSRCWTGGYVYLGGDLVALYNASTTSFVHKDHLGSTRLVTSLSGAVTDNDDYLPYGEQETGDTVTTHKFTGKERDSESGLDEFGARYYSSSIGRFMIPDWAEKPTAVPYASFGNPQSLNLYSYVNNNPTTTRDPDGHETQDTLDPQAAQEAGQTIGDVIVGSAKGLWNSMASLSNAVNATFINGPAIAFTGHAVLTDAPEAEYSNTTQAVAGTIAPLAAAAQGMVGDAGAVGEAATASRGGETADTIAGRQAHADFAAKVESKPGWQSEPRLTDPATGKTVKPDAVSRAGRPVELKPDTPSGRAAGRRQLPKYERATGKRGRVVYYKKDQPQ